MHAIVYRIIHVCMVFFEALRTVVGFALILILIIILHLRTKVVRFRPLRLCTERCFSEIQGLQLHLGILNLFGLNAEPLNVW